MNAGARATSGDILWFLHGDTVASADAVATLTPEERTTLAPLLEKKPEKRSAIENFGDVFAGYVAARMGLPIARLIVATNVNDILHRALTNGDYSSTTVPPPAAGTRWAIASAARSSG